MTYILLSVIVVMMLRIFYQSIQNDLLKTERDYYKNEFELNTEQSIKEIESPYESD